MATVEEEDVISAMHALNNEVPWWIVLPRVEEPDPDGVIEWDYEYHQWSSLPRWPTSSDYCQHPAYVPLVSNEGFMMVDVS